MHFHSEGMKIMVLPQSSQRQATLHRSVALNCSIPTPIIMKNAPLQMQERIFHGEAAAPISELVSISRSSSAVGMVRGSSLKVK